MMKLLKTLILIAISYSLGEFITQWRQQTKPISLKEYAKYYLKSNKAVFDQGYRTGELLRANPERGKEALTDLIFPNRTK